MLISKVQKINGVPVLCVNDKPIAPIFICNFREEFFNSVELFSKHDLHLFTSSLPLFCAQSPSEEQEFKDKVDRFMERLLSIDPKALFLPRIELIPPQWWKDRHPEELLRWKDGKASGHVSMSSRLWYEKMLPDLASEIEYIEKNWGDNIIGYTPAAGNTGEWYHEYWQYIEGELNCFEKVFETDFQLWVRKKYGAIARLNEKWCSCYNDFSEIVLPTAEERWSSEHGVFHLPEKEFRLIDFTEFQSRVILRNLREVCRTVKDSVANQKLTIPFYGYIMELCGTEHGYGLGALGQALLRDVLKEPSIDSLVTCISYFDRGPGGSMNLDAPVESAAYWGKLWMNEDDMRTHLAKETVGFGRSSNADETEWNQLRNFSKALTHRSACWFMDFSAGWLHSERIAETFQKFNTVYQDFLKEPKIFESDCQVVVDDYANFQLAYEAGWKLCRPMIYHQRAQYNRIGTSHELWAQNDFIGGNAPLRKMILFLNAFFLSKYEIETIRKRLENSGVVAVWFYAPGYISDNTPNLESMKELTGFEFQVETEERPVAVKAETSSDLMNGLKNDRFPTPNDSWLWEEFHQAEMPKVYCRDQLELDQPDFKWNESDLKARTISPRFSINPNQKGNEILARFIDGPIAIALRKEKGFSSVYIGTNWVPRKFLANLAKYAGCHLYSEDGDVIISDGTILSITACTEGEKKITLKNKSRILNIMDDKLVSDECLELKLDMKENETRLFKFATV